MYVDQLLCPQLEGLALVIRSLTNVQQTPSLETPQYTVLRRTGEYEVCFSTISHTRP